MPEIEEECTFEVSTKNCSFETQMNGTDRLILSKMDLSPETAASLAWLVNQPGTTLRFEVKQNV
ncbi:MAG TPA: hypothetical protein VMW50_08195 [Dehalococcoidia bacterium]|nr:hypothetical protein [Dehalococcoidia bacterium]